MTVQGHPLHWRPGQPCSLPPLGAGVEVSVHEPDVVVATVSGAFRLGEDGMLQVDDTLMVDVQQHPTPIDFPGNVTLEGGFAAGINLKAGGDVLVHGGIEHADIEAGGSITVEGGILSSQVRSGGTVRAKLAREAAIEAGEDVALSQECVNCEVTAQGEIAVCGARCHGGQIMGGHLKAGSRILTFDVGVPTSGRTVLEAGQGWVRARRLKDLDHEIELCRPEIDRLESELVRVANNPAYKGSVEGVKTDLYDAWEKLRPLEAARTELAEATANAASIEVHGTIQARVRLDVDGVSYEVERACARQRFVADRTKNEIKQEDLK